MAARERITINRIFTFMQLHIVLIVMYSAFNHCGVTYRDACSVVHRPVPYCTALLYSAVLYRTDSTVLYRTDITVLYRTNSTVLYRTVLYYSYYAVPQSTAVTVLLVQSA